MDANEFIQKNTKLMKLLKARLVEKMIHSNIWSDYLETFAPILKMSMVRVIFFLGVKHKFAII